MKDIYRVVCSQNQSLYPNRIFVDFMPAEASQQENCLNHEAMLKMRRLTYPDVENIEDGLIITDYGNGRLELGYEQGYIHKKGQNLDKFREQYEDLVFERFRQMKKAGKEKTIDVSLHDLVKLYGFHQTENDNSPKSAREIALIEEAKKIKEAEHKKKERAQQSTKEKDWTTEQILRWKYSRYSGD